MYDKREEFIGKAGYSLLDKFNQAHSYDYAFSLGHNNYSNLNHKISKISDPKKLEQFITSLTIKLYQIGNEKAKNEGRKTFPVPDNLKEKLEKSIQLKNKQGTGWKEEGGLLSISDKDVFDHAETQQEEERKVSDLELLEQETETETLSKKAIFFS